MHLKSTQNTQIETNPCGFPKGQVQKWQKLLKTTTTTNKTFKYNLKKQKKRKKKWVLYGEMSRFFSIQIFR